MKARKLFILILFGLLTALGVRSGNIIPDELLGDPKFGMAARFLNRYSYLLSLPDTEEKEDRIRRVKDDGFSYEKGNDAAFLAIPEGSDFSIDFNKGVYAAQWSVGDKVMVACRFPAKVGLMKQENKKDLELLLIDRFRSAPVSDIKQSIPSATDKDVRKIPFSDFYVRNGDSFISSKLANHTVFLPKDGDKGSFILVFDPGKYPVETVSNMFLTGYSPSRIPIELQIKQYGYASTSVDTGLAELFSIFSEEGCSPYWGLKENVGENVKGLYLWKNDMGGYCHVVSVDMPLSAISEGGKVNATLHCYVRLDNLKSLFDEYPEL